jgi:hypothetical protein
VISRATSANGQRTGEEAPAERAGPIAIERQGPEARRADLQGEGEHRRGPGCGHNQGEGRPANRRRQLWLPHRPPPAVGVDDGPLPDGELHVHDQ